MDKLEVNGHISETGEVVIQNRRLLREWANKFRGKNIKIRIERAGSRRSHPQNNFYFGVVVEVVRLALLQLGHQMTKEETHEFLKMKFNMVSIANSHGEELHVPGTTTTMTKTEFGEYIDKIAQWCAEYLGIVLPQPGENLELQLH
jgi:hypothetical protein